MPQLMHHPEPVAGALPVMHGWDEAVEHLGEWGLDESELADCLGAILCAGWQPVALTCLHCGEQIFDDLQHAETPSKDHTCWHCGHVCHTVKPAVVNPLAHLLPRL
jgi:hypothetical protein